jgi:hypothetical protein
MGSNPGRDECFKQGVIFLVIHKLSGMPAGRSVNEMTNDERSVKHQIHLNTLVESGSQPHRSNCFFSRALPGPAFPACVHYVRDKIQNMLGASSRMQAFQH